MKKSNLILIISILFFGAACNQKNKLPIKETKNSKYESLKKNLEKDLIGLWRLHSVTFRESKLVDSSEGKVLSKIKLSDTVNIEFKSNHQFVINSKNIGKWEFQELDIKLSGKDVNLSVPFFCNSKYRIGIQKTYSKLTVSTNVSGSLYDIQYLLVRIS